MTKEMIRADIKITTVSTTKAISAFLALSFLSFSLEALKGPLIGFSTLSFLAMMEG